MITPSYPNGDCVKTHRIYQILLILLCALWTLLIHMGSVYGFEQHSWLFLVSPAIIGVIMVVMIEFEERIG